MASAGYHFELTMFDIPAELWGLVASYLRLYELRSFRSVRGCAICFCSIIP